ncbi:integrase [Desulfosalsimonas propionicica]|uniref:Integrase n=1 Tax=Desulfosalsimonas propionicica TaxID=332175 RepID=A0A7W0CC87_9BACT|nr:site-specific integrase [Desulfosalsimonas propionicica]MBA2883093.1 integrase [Desulfosalsimonas propionicica]
MADTKRKKTDRTGVYFRDVTRPGGKGIEKMYYVTFKRGDKKLEEKVGGQYRDNMTPAKAARIRTDLIEGRRLTRKEEKAKKEAQKKAEAGKPTMQRLWQEFEKAKADNKSIRDDRYRWQSHLKPVFADKTPGELVTLDIDRLRRNLLKKKNLAPATAKQVLVLLKRIINHGVKRGLCPALDPGRLHIEMPKVNNETTEDLSPDQLKKLMKAIEKAEDWRGAGILKLALYSGMRRGELLALQWQHVDLDRGFIRIVDPKGGRDESIPINQSAIETLKNLPRTKSPYVFPGRGGRKASDLKKPIQAIKEAAGLPKNFRPCHGLRHVFASTLASSGKVDMYVLQKLLTHKDPKMTARYAHLRDSALRDASGVMDNAFTNTDEAENEEANRG